MEGDRDRDNAFGWAASAHARPFEPPFKFIKINNCLAKSLGGQGFEMRARVCVCVCRLPRGML